MVERDNINITSEAQAVCEAQIFVNGNIVDASDNDRICFDGRFDPKKTKGALARPGGDFGFVLGLLKLKRDLKIYLTTTECVDTVYNTVGAVDGKFYMHTDDNAQGDPKIPTGCGHIALSLDRTHAEMYGVRYFEVIEALEYIRSKKADGKVVETSLPGDHAEKGVLIIRGTEKTLNHNDNHSMYFVYDKDRDEKLQEKIVNEINIPRLKIEDYRAALEKQTNTTVSLLASGKPMIEVDLTNDAFPQLNFIGIIPSL